MLSENGEGFKAETWLITSSQPAEGKTTTAINVAISIAQLRAVGVGRGLRSAHADRPRETPDRSEARFVHLSFGRRRIGGRDPEVGHFGCVIDSERRPFRITHAN